MLLTYNATTVGTLIAGFRITFRDTILPFMLAIFEFLLFSTLQQATTVLYWYLVFAGFTLSTSLIVHSIIRKLKPEEYEPPIRDLIKNYTDRMKQDRMNSTVCCLLSLVFGLLNVLVFASCAVWQQWYWIPAVFVLVGLLIGLYQQEMSRRAIWEFVVKQSSQQPPS
jgi:hypothetical protein